MTLSSCLTGDLSESIFAVEAIRRGYTVYTPNVGHSHPADAVVVKPPSRPISMQLKTATIDKGRNCSYSVQVCRGRGKTKVSYQLGDFDILAAWLPDRQLFVFWHFAEIAERKKVCYSPLRHRAPDNWDLLAADDNSPVADIITVQPHALSISC